MDEAEVKYTIFREWLGTADSSEISDERWGSLLEEDEAYDYQSKGNGLGEPVVLGSPQPVNEVNVYTTDLRDDASDRSGYEDSTD